MILADVNVLIYAFRNDAPDYHLHREWLESVLNGSAAYGMSPQVLSSLVRITTNPRIYFRPTPLDRALEFCEVLMAQPHCQIIKPGEGHWSIFSDICRRAKIQGDLVQDAWFAALAMEHACEWITHDRDYARFPGLRWRPPF